MPITSYYTNDPAQVREWSHHLALTIALKNAPDNGLLKKAQELYEAGDLEKSRIFLRVWSGTLSLREKR